MPSGAAVAAAPAAGGAAPAAGGAAAAPAKKEEPSEEDEVGVFLGGGCNCWMHELGSQVAQQQKVCALPEREG